MYRIEIETTHLQIEAKPILKKELYNENVFIHTLMVLFLISGTHFVFADCPKEHLKAEASFSINEDDEAYIYARASVSNLTYWPFMVFGRAYISSDHSVVCYHYYESKDHPAKAWVL